ncbi:MAG: pyridine nucleotide-disulfide oxidoreductase, partial [Burkholderiales bacterium]
MSRSRLALAIVIVALGAVFFAAGGQRYLSVETLKTQQGALLDYYAAHAWQTALGFFLVYVAVTGLSLPGAAL